MTRLLPWLLLLGAAGAGCQKEDPAFLPFDELCPQRAEALCDALAHCCAADKVPLNCELALTRQCETDKAALEREDLSYYTVQASRVLSAQREAWRDCGTLLPIASYFQDGLANGAACERDSQCAEGSCSSEGTCASAAQVVPELCLPPEP